MFNTNVYHNRATMEEKQMHHTFISKHARLAF